MRRLARRAAAGSRPRIEVLEARSLMSADLSGGQWPLHDDPATDLLVRFAATTPAATEQTVLNGLGAYVVRSFPDGPSEIALGQGVDPAGAVKALQADPTVLYAERGSDPIRVASTVPNDPQFAQQWGLSNPNGIDIGATSAWDVTTGNPATVVAVIDSGIDLTNADLAGKVWTNPVANQDGYAGDYHGWNYIGNNGNVQDYDGHGTHVSGIIAAATNNGVGIAGVDWAAQIMPLKTIDANGDGTIDNAVAAIYFAVQHGARVINASWDGPEGSQSLADAINYAGTNGAVFVSAAGNESANNDVVPTYPSSYRAPNAITVAAVDQNGNLASFSNYGPTTVDIAAPGVNVLSTYLGGGYAALSGTSMSAPFVSGAVALLVGLHPELSAAQLVQRILATARPLPSLAGKLVTGGMLNIAAALDPGTVSLAGLGGGLAVSGVTPLSPNSTPQQVRAALLASDEFLLQHGGTAEGFVTGLYQDVFGRSPDAPGLALWESWLANGHTRIDVVNALLSSTEIQLRQVAGWYQNELGRAQTIDQLEADPGVQAWNQAFAGGMSDDMVHDGILASEEYYIKHGSTPLGFVSGLCEDVFGRVADPGALTGWVQQLEAGVPRVNVALAFIMSSEGRATQVARWFQKDLARGGSLATLKADPGVLAWAALIG